MAQAPTPNTGDYRPVWRFLIRRRPFCPDHPERLMDLLTQDKQGIGRWYCGEEGCERTWQGRAIVTLDQLKALLNL